MDFLLLKIYCIFHFFCRFLYLINTSHKCVTQLLSSSTFPWCQLTCFMPILSFFLVPEEKLGVLMSLSKAAPSMWFKTLFLQPLKTLYLLYFQLFPLTSLLTFVSKKYAWLLPILRKNNKLLFIAIFFLWTIFLIPLSNVWKDLYPMPLFSKHLFFTLPSTIPLQTPLTPLL